MKRKMTFSELIEKKHYANIILLLNNFQQKEKFGLSQKHFRFALMETHGLDKLYTVPHMEKFFGKDLVKLGIEKIPKLTPQKLTNYLKILVDKKIIEPKGKRPNTRYRLCYYGFFGEYFRRQTLRNISMWDPELIGDTRKFLSNPLFTPDKNKTHFAYGTIYGWPLEITESLTAKEKIASENAIKQIYNASITLNKLKLKYIKTRKSRLGIFVQTYNYDVIKKDKK